ncbi:ABC transporter substrate-binding protein [Actinoallomurus iriomotensis]|uniref:Peptide ABC transporter substrate-binding protein n=1 Tax=Actinoallomurus iriomotensis TaxID=478107 RepID=A0A9W6RZ27_9ACTN|nr:ABC transporter substrate-binding protein [Actinoallomurus iriomotensis]GLY85421.1 peptide ABC transporter substrate-binding protein [Actinoallomurus iriomotensis]
MNTALSEPSRRSFLGLGLATGSLLLAAACGSGGVAGAGGTTADTLKWGWDLPTSWDPVTSSAGWDVHALSLVYAGLTKHDEQGNAVPALAESWKYSDKGGRVTFKLRSGLKFSDGTALDAAAVKKSIERGRDAPKSLIAAQLVDIKTVSAPDATTVVLELKAPNYQIPSLFAGKTGMVVNPAAFEGDAAGLATKPAGAGPYTLTSYVENSQATLKRNPAYWDAANIKAENFQLFPLPDAATVIAGLRSGRYNVAQIPGSQVAAAKAAGLEVQVIPSLVVAVLDVNVTKAPFDDPNVVLALKYAVDRAALLKTQQFGIGEVSYQPFPKGYVGYDPGLEGIYAYDPAKARALLAASKYGAGTPVTITASSPGTLAQQLQAQLQAVGFKPAIETIPESQATQIIYIQHDKALAVDGFAGRDSTAQAFQVLFGAEGLMNPGRTTSPELTAAVQKIVQTPLEDPRYPEVVRAATSAAVRTMPNVFLYTTPRILAHAKSVSALPKATVVQRFEGVTAA